MDTDKVVALVLGLVVITIIVACTVCQIVRYEVIKSGYCETPVRGSTNLILQKCI